MNENLEKQLFELTVSQLPSGMVRDLLRVMPLIYRDAHARSYSDPAWELSEAQDLCGHMRRTLMESRFRNIALKHGQFAKAFKNCQRTSNYTLVRSGRLVITESAIQHESQMVRPAVFRKQHSAVNKLLSQPTLPGLNIHPPELFERGEIYAILFHGPQWRNPKELGFATLGFPSNGSHRILVRFPLASIHKAQSGVATHEEIINDLAKPRLKRKKGIQDQ